MSSSSTLLDLLLLAALLLPTGFSLTATDCTIHLGSSLSTRNRLAPWLSPSGEFAFGFQRLETDKNLFLLAIWFNKIPEKTIVWSANGDLPAPKDSKITLTNTGELVLNDPRGKELWRAETAGNRSACAAMLDVGNFMLLNGSFNPIWESFKLPTDTILPSQILEMNKRLPARQSEKNYAKGRFLLGLQPDRNLVLYTISVPTEVLYGPYWASNTVQMYRTSNSKALLVFDDAGFIYLQDGTKRIFNLTDVSKKPDSGQDFYRLARIDFDGVFRQYSRPKTGISPWKVVKYVPEDICSSSLSELGSGTCGPNSYCVNEGDGRHSCSCPDGYSYLDRFDPHKGCKPDFELPSCFNGGWETRSELVEFKEINDTDWPLSDYELREGMDKETCKKICQEDCFCVVAIFRDRSCWKKKYPLSNGRKNIATNATALIKVPKDISSVQNNKSTLILVGSLLLGSSVFLNIIMLLGISVVIFFSYQRSLSRAAAPNVKCYTYKELEEATGGFNQILGRGAFGTVYKGVLASDPNGFVAVKKLENIEEEEGKKEFATEVSIIGQTHHKNLVRLLGYCDEGEHRLLVYEYMNKGSLANFLFGISKLDWNQRVQISLGIARGLMYLHEECGTQIVHCDMKPQNVLLDDNFTPRISDFGLANLLLAEQTRAACSGGYFAPELIRNASITAKVDVYSFGVMLLEIICSKSIAFAKGYGENALIDWAYDCYKQKKLDKLVEDDEEARIDMRRVERILMVAIWCIQDDPFLRPSMKKVTQMLEGVVEVSVPPCPSNVFIITAS